MKFEQQNKHCCNLIKFGKFWRLTFQFSPLATAGTSQNSAKSQTCQINETSMSEYFMDVFTLQNIWRGNFKANTEIVFLSCFLSTFKRKPRVEFSIILFKNIISCQLIYCAAQCSLPSPLSKDCSVAQRGPAKLAAQIQRKQISMK